ncbi:unnamed protein product, partial [marine sediment metagenome]
MENQSSDMAMSAPILRARYLNEGDFPTWRTVVDGSLSGSVYSYPEYLDAVCRAAGGSF